MVQCDAAKSGDRYRYIRYSLVIPLKKNSNPKMDIISEVQNVENWCRLNKLSLNEDKSKILVCPRNDDLLNLDLPIATADKVTILGLSLIHI